jgi:mRNA interferase MazF
MTKGKIVLVPFPFDDLSGAKVRPALCLSDPIGPHRHVIVAFITSKIPSSPEVTDLVIDPRTADYSQTGLRVASTVRLHRLLTLNTSLFSRELGELSPAAQLQVDERLRQLFGLR